MLLKKDDIRHPSENDDEHSSSAAAGMRNCDLTREETEVGFQRAIMGSDGDYPFLHEIQHVEGEEPLGYGRCDNVTLVRYRCYLGSI